MRERKAYVARGAGLCPFSLSATRVLLPGVVSEKVLNSAVQFQVRLTTPLDPKSVRITTILRVAGVIRDFQSQRIKSAGVPRSFPLRKGSPLKPQKHGAFPFNSLLIDRM